jgi:hypothetical protein
MKIFNTIYKINIKKEVEKIIPYLIEECIKDRHTLNKNLGNNFLVNTIHTEFLYKIFKKNCKKFLNKFTLKDTNFKTWCYFSDSSYTGVGWHNHIKTCTINGVLYIKLPKNEKGIDFKIKDKVVNFIPKEFDLLIFPDYLDHFPYPSTTEEARISINLELRCLEKSKDIFK